MSDSFDDILKAASKHAKSYKTQPFRTLIDGFEFEDTSMVIALLKFIN